MSRHFTLVVALAAAASITACGRAGSETAAESAPANDGKALAAGPEQTALGKDRDDYRSQMQADIDSFDQKVRDLEAKEKAATGKIKSDLDGALPLLRAQRATFVGDLRAIDTATEASWGPMKARLDSELAELKGAADRAG
jgi:Skp family chaperone for outer membrane proteins